MSNSREAKCVLPGYETSTPEAQHKELVKIFKRVAKTADGKIVFNAILTDLHFFNEAKTEAEKALCEYAKYLLRERLGVKKTFDITNAIIDHLD